MRHVRKPPFLLAAVFAAIVASSAYAITYGHADGGGHPSTGALVFFSPTRHEYRIECSGTLISPTVFLTASHCTAFLEANGISNVGVSFDSQFDAATSKVYTGTMHTNPLFNQRASDPEDIAVVTFAHPIQGIAPVQLPTAGLLDRMSKDKSIKSASFTSVGYGDQEPTNAPGGKVYPFTGDRRVATGSFNALNKVWLRLSENPSHGRRRHLLRRLRRPAVPRLEQSAGLDHDLGRQRLPLDEPGLPAGHAAGPRLPGPVRLAALALLG